MHITLIVLLSIFLAISLAAHIKNQRKNPWQSTKGVELIYDINNALLSSRDASAIIQSSLGYLREALGRSAAFLRTGANAPDYYFDILPGDLSEGSFLSLGAAFLAGSRSRKVPAATANIFTLPLSIDGKSYGLLMLSLKKGPLTASDLSLSHVVCRQTAQALHVQALAILQQEALVEAEAVKARNSFLRGISHDLRTPLTSVIGASATFLDTYWNLTDETRLKLVSGIQTDTQWLLSMVENILSVTRIHKDGMTITKTVEAIEEIVGEAVSIFRRHQPEMTIEIRQNDELLLAAMDALLITRVISNLLDNARRHAGTNPMVIISTSRRDDCALFTISDNGPGIPPAVMSGLFNMQPSQPGLSEDAGRGHGMGLFICKTIIDAHNGWIKANNLPQGGACFTFALPMETEAQHGK